MNNKYLVYLSILQYTIVYIIVYIGTYKNMLILSTGRHLLVFTGGVARFFFLVAQPHCCILFTRICGKAGCSGPTP